MINTKMKSYQYFTYGVEDQYGQQMFDNSPKGQIKMTINLSSQNVQDNINYKDCQYIGLTHDEIDESYLIQYGKKLLKVLYVNEEGRLKQVFLAQSAISEVQQ